MAEARRQTAGAGVVCCQLGLPQDPATPLQLLCLGAHSDDIEIGCGGTILQLLSDYRNVNVVWVVFSSGREREREARASAALFLKQAKRRTKIIVKNFRDGFFPISRGRPSRNSSKSSSET